VISLSSDTFDSVLCIGAHADDIEIGCGGTILHLLEMNPALSVHMVVLSGSDIRRKEAETAAGMLLGAESPETLETRTFRDAHFPYTEAEDLKRYFADLSARIKPQVVFTHRRDDLHQDHRMVSDLTWQHFRDQLILEYEIPKYEGDLAAPNTYVPISRENIERKAEILLAAFPSQADKYWFDRELFLSMAKIRGIECRSPSGYAEAFHGRKILLF